VPPDARNCDRRLRGIYPGWYQGRAVYSAKGQNPTTNASDMGFADGVQNELATVVGSPTTGYTATFTVGVSV
jgi:hypothetical protein